jgi:hypothetical protein
MHCGDTREYIGGQVPHLFQPQDLSCAGSHRRHLRESEWVLGAKTFEERHATTRTRTRQQCCVSLCQSRRHCIARTIEEEFCIRVQ